MEKLALGERQGRKRFPINQDYSKTLGCHGNCSGRVSQPHLWLPGSSVNAKALQTPQTLKIHPSKSFQLRPVFSPAQHEMKLSPQRGSFHHETIQIRNQSDFSLLLEHKTILKRRNSA